MERGRERSSPGGGSVRTRGFGGSTIPPLQCVERSDFHVTLSRIHGLPRPDVVMASVAHPDALNVVSRRADEVIRVVTNPDN
jgi:hypothetical protein